MEDNNKCIILTHKEYEKLKAKAEQAKSNKVDIYLCFDIRYRNTTINTRGTIDLSDNLKRQVRRIATIVGENNRQQLIDEVNRRCEEEKRAGYNDAMAEFASLSWFERLVFKGKAKAKVYLTL